METIKQNRFHIVVALRYLFSISGRRRVVAAFEAFFTRGSAC